MSGQIAFWILSAIAVLGALVAVRKRNLIHGVFALMIFFAALSGLFLLLLAEFIAAVQVLVYIGVWHTAVKAVGHIPSTWFAHLKVCDLRFRDLSFKSSHMHMV